jgi:hypothetical protein
MIAAGAERSHTNFSYPFPLYPAEQVGWPGNFRTVGHFRLEYNITRVYLLGYILDVKAILLGMQFPDWLGALILQSVQTAL